MGFAGGQSRITRRYGKSDGHGQANARITQNYVKWGIVAPKTAPEGAAEQTFRFLWLLGGLAATERANAGEANPEQGNGSGFGNLRRGRK